MAGRLENRVAIITGASSGIGAAIAQSYAAEGASVVMAARRLDKMQALIDQMGPLPVRPIAVETDVRREADVLRLFESVDRLFGKIDIVVSNAGFADHTPTDQLTLARWQDIVDTNLTGAFLCARESLRRMKTQRRGRIIIVGSISAKSPRPNSIGYTSTKFALDGMTRSLALDGRDFGVAVSIIHPGSTKTELMPRMVEKPRTESMVADEIAQVATLMASLPDETNLLEATILPIGQPFLGRG